MKILTEKFCQCFYSFFICCAFTLHFLCKVSVDSLELYILMFLFQTGNKCTVNVVFQDNSILSCLFEHINILALLNLISYIEDYGLLRLFLLCIFIFFRCSIFFLLFCLIFRFFCFFLVLFNAIFQCQIFAVKILEEYIISHFLCKFSILDAAIFNEWADVIPVFFIGFTVCFAHSCQFICYLLGNILGNLLYKSIILQCTSGYVQRQIRAVNYTFQQKKEFRNYLFDIICDKYLVIIQFDCSFDRIILCIDLREVQDTF